MREAVYSGSNKISLFSDIVHCSNRLFFSNVNENSKQTRKNFQKFHMFLASERKRKFIAAHFANFRTSKKNVLLL